MRKALITISLVLLLAAPLLGAACAGGPTITDSDVKTFRGLITRVDNLEASDASQNGKLAKLNTDTLQTDVSQVKTDITAVKADIIGIKTTNSTDSTKIDALEARIKTLEDKLAASTNPTPTSAGQVTATVTQGSVTYLYSGAANNPFTVHLTNGTAIYQWVSFCLIMQSPAPASDVFPGVHTATLACSNYPGATWTTTYTPNAPAATTQILFTPTTKIMLAPGQPIDMWCLVQSNGDIFETWQGMIIPIAAATGP